MALVAHDGVDHHDAVGAAELVDELADHRDLLRRSQEARADAAELQAELAPLADVLAHVGREILEAVAGETRVVGQHRGGQYAALHAKLGDDGKLHRNRASAEAGEVVDERDLLLVVMVGQGGVGGFGGAHVASFLGLLCNAHIIRESRAGLRLAEQNARGFRFRERWVLGVFCKTTQNRVGGRARR